MVSEFKDPTKRTVDDEYIMPCGKYKGEKIGAIPASYLLWFGDQEWCKDKWPLVYRYIRQHEDELQDDEAYESEIDYEPEPGSYDGWKDPV